MSPTALLRLTLFLLVLLLIDLYAWKAISTALGGSSIPIRRWARLIYWAVSIGILAAIVWTVVAISDLRQTRNYSFVFSLVAVVLLFFLPKFLLGVFHLVEDALTLLRWAWCQLVPGDGAEGGITTRIQEERLTHALGANGISRLRFLSQVGLALAAIPFGGVLYGVTHGRRNFRVERVTVPSNGLPPEFDGLRIVHISDLHLGSFNGGSDLVRRGVELINAEEPDLILFTGDLVNDYNEEALPWLDTLKDLRARLGKFSILGNHDYSDYASWDSREVKAENLKKLIGHHAAMGFRILLDEHVGITRGSVRTNAGSRGGAENAENANTNAGSPGGTEDTENANAGGGATIGLLGVQNWGHRFQQYGDLAKTMRGSERYPFRILMSHDPSHWDGQVRDFTDAGGRRGVDLMLSGHTHGAQLGFTIKGTTYSPAQWVYKQWAGLYEQDGQHLYVNRGFGYIGFPGRIGMPPEITVLELKRV